MRPGSNGTSQPRLGTTWDVFRSPRRSRHTNRFRGSQSHCDKQTWESGTFQLRFRTFPNVPNVPETSPPSPTSESMYEHCQPRTSGRGRTFQRHCWTSYRRFETSGNVPGRSPLELRALGDQFERPPDVRCQRDYVIASVLGVVAILWRHVSGLEALIFLRQAPKAWKPFPLVRVNDQHRPDFGDALQTTREGRHPVRKNRNFARGCDPEPRALPDNLGHCVPTYTGG